MSVFDGTSPRIMVMICQMDTADTTKISKDVLGKIGMAFIYSLDRVARIKGIEDYKK